MIRRALTISFVLAASAILSAQQKPTSIAAASAVVEANLKTSEGKAYDAEIGQAFMKNYAPVVKSCKEKAAGDLRPFDMLIRVDEGGASKEVLLFPLTKLAQCLRPALLSGTFPKPPKTDYWFDIHLELKH